MLRITKPLTLIANPLGTRLIGGISIPLQGTIPVTQDGSDPWLNRFPAGKRASVRFVDLDAMVGDRASSVLAAWPSTPISVAQVNPSETRQPFVATFGETAMRYAEMESTAGDRWGIASAADPAAPQDSFFTTEVAQWPANSTAADVLSNQRDLRCTVFAQVDFDCFQTGVSALNPALGKISLASTNLATGARANSFNSRQRFLLWNAPEFLDEPFEMVFNSATRRIYFLPPENVSIDPTGEANPLTWLNISLPILGANATTVDPTGLYIESSGVSIQGFRFDTFFGNAILSYDRNNLSVVDCSFSNVGSTVLNINGGTNIFVDRCAFDSTSKSHVVIQSSSPATALSNFGLLNPSAVRIEDSVFRHSGMIWPNAQSVAIGSLTVGSSIDKCSFEDIGGAAIVYGGARNVFSNNQFVRCLTEVTEYGVIYTGRSIVSIGNIISGNTFNSVRRLSRSGLADFTSAIMQDDFGCGNIFERNKFVDVENCFQVNGGRYHLFNRNVFTRIDRVIVKQNWPMVPSSWQEFISVANAIGPNGFRMNRWFDLEGVGAYMSFDPENQTTAIVNDLAVLASAARVTSGSETGSIRADVDLTRTLKLANWLARPLTPRGSTQVDKILSFGNMFVYADSDFDDAAENPFAGPALRLSTGLMQTPWGPADAYNVSAIRAADPTYTGGNLPGITGLRIVQQRQQRER
jgi:hypothetical protein